MPCSPSVPVNWRRRLRTGSWGWPRGYVMPDHLKAVLRYLRVKRHVAPHTVRAYESDVSQYLAGVASESGKKIPQLGPSDLDMSSVRGHVAELNKAGKARSSVAR